MGSEETKWLKKIANTEEALAKTLERRESNPLYGSHSSEHFLKLIDKQTNEIAHQAIVTNKILMAILNSKK